jgi:hypothetical protein
LSRDVHFISGLMAHKVPFIVAELGMGVDPFIASRVLQHDRFCLADAPIVPGSAGVFLNVDCLAHRQSGRDSLFLL